MRHMEKIGFLSLLLGVSLSCGFGTELSASPDASFTTVSGAETRTAAVPVQSLAVQTPQQPAQNSTTPTPPTGTTQVPATGTANASGVAAPSAPTAATMTAASVPAATPASADNMSRTERRHYKLERFAQGIDSLVKSHNFRFLPNSMQEMPGGYLQLIYNELYFIGVFSDHVEVHMPTIRGGVVQYFEVLNFDTFDVRDYQIAKTQYGWNISFNLYTNGETAYTINMMVYPYTGETVLTMLTSCNAVRYVGSIQSTALN